MLSIVIVALAAIGFVAASFTIHWFDEQEERHRFMAALSADEWAAMRDFCINGRTWRDYREWIDRERVASGRRTGDAYWRSRSASGTATMSQ